MKIDWKKINIYIRTGYTDMRKQIGSLSALVEQEFKMSPFSGDLFVFCGASRKILKVLYWEKNGFCMWVKRLATDHFPWPVNEREVRQIKSAEMQMLLAGIDFFHAHQERKYEVAS